MNGKNSVILAINIIQYSYNRLDVLTPVSVTPDNVNGSTCTSANTTPTMYTVDGVKYIPSGSTSNRLNSWLAINIVRAICYNISWMSSIWLNSYNRLEGQLSILKV